MTVGDIMTRKVVSCRKDTDVGTAARLMLVGRFGALPVVDSHGRVAGIITDRDIAMATATRQRNASHIAVHEAMTEKVHTCVVDDEIGAALKQMEAARVRRLPVVDTASHLVGFCHSTTSSSAPTTPTTPPRWRSLRRFGESIHSPPSRTSPPSPLLRKRIVPGRDSRSEKGERLALGAPFAVLSSTRAVRRVTVTSDSESATTWTSRATDLQGDASWTHRAQILVA